MPKTDPDIQTVSLISLGCPKNLVDSEKMFGLLASDGLIPVGDESEADAIVVNTCGFLEAAKEESLSVIREAAERKKAGSLKRLVVAGCLVQRHKAKMLEWCPDIDALIGVFDRDHIVEAVRGSRPQQKDLATDLPVYSSIASNATLRKRRDGIEAEGYFESDAARLRLTPRHYAFLRMSEGCNQNCAFCTIPSIRGKMRSKPIDAIRAEAAELMSDGAFELNLIGQDTTSYGDDIGYPAGLPGLLRELDALATDHGGAWIRLMYAYPTRFSDELVDMLAGLKHIVPYVDMPLQHANDRILESMKRHTKRAQMDTLLSKLRDRDIAVRTTLISGYPTETDAEHDELLEFVQSFPFEHLGVFPYSPEPGTPAGRLHAEGGAIPDDVIDSRIEDLMMAQQDRVFERNQQAAKSQTGVTILIDALTSVEGRATPGVEMQEGHLAVGRSPRQAPDIDSVTYVRSLEPLAPGEVVDCTIVDADGYDLIARPTSELHTAARLPIL